MNCLYKVKPRCKEIVSIINQVSIRFLQRFLDFEEKARNCEDGVK